MPWMGNQPPVRECREAVREGSRGHLLGGRQDLESGHSFDDTGKFVPSKTKPPVFRCGEVSGMMLNGTKRACISNRRSA